MTSHFNGAVADVTSPTAFTGESMGYPAPSPPVVDQATTSELGISHLTTFTADLSPTHSTFTRLRAGIAGAMLAEFFGTFVLPSP